MMIFIAGNGGLAAESEHFAAELMGKYGKDVYIPCISLTSNTSLLTALANDLGWENVFSHQIEVMGQPGDIFIGMTTSHSKNILKAAKVARKKGMEVILLDGDNLPGADVAAKQESALSILHKMALKLKEKLEVNENTLCKSQQ